MSRADIVSHLLMVDCDPRSLAMLSKSLDRLGMRSHAVVDDAPVALEAVNGIIVELDHFNSERLLAKARGMEIPIVAMTHHQTLSQVQRAVRLGATAILNKPITQSTVYTTLAMAKELREQHQTLASANHQLAQRLSQQGTIARAVARLMVSLTCDEDEAFEQLRHHAMSARTSLEQAAEKLLMQSGAGKARRERSS